MKQQRNFRSQEEYFRITETKSTVKEGIRKRQVGKGQNLTTISNSSFSLLIYIYIYYALGSGRKFYIALTEYSYKTELD